MAVTKIKPVKSTVKKALDYIENPAKTDGKLLVSSFGCSFETADIEFHMELKQARQKGNNIAHHLIQSFAPGEATPEQAHEIGRQLANAVLGGKYEYVLSTHIDKGHVHNHIIFCAVDMVEHKKYISNKQSYAYIRRTSDRLCKENGLSIVAPGQNSGKSYAEYQAEKIGMSWKGKLKITIDAVIPLAADFGDFLRRMEAAGYEIKRGKYISFRAPGQERFTCCKTLSERYTEEAITDRINGKPIVRNPRQERKTISLLAEIESSIKAQQSAGLERWNKIEYLKQAAKTMNFVTEHDIEAYGDLESKVAELAVANDAAAASLKGAERRLADMALLIKNVTTYKQTKPIADDYRRAKDKPRYRREHDSALIFYEAAARALKDGGIKKLPDLAALKAEYDRLAGEKEKLASEYGKAKKTLKEYGIIKQNVDSILRRAPGQERTQEL
ncbi:MAG: relaxase/mobilization nuclease domain-containing protein [Candidatus Pelethousia sp.]|nr:relaxase/mobilization nuclease domain-containing protein [Candidatus Pelethousia sp.]